MSRPTWARWVTRISLILALVALVFTIRDIGLRTIATYFRRIGWWWIPGAPPAGVVNSPDARAGGRVGAVRARGAGQGAAARRGAAAARRARGQRGDAERQPRRGREGLGA